MRQDHEKNHQRMLLADWLGHTRNTKKTRTDKAFLTEALATCEAFSRFRQDTREGDALAADMKLRTVI